MARLYCNGPSVCFRSTWGWTRVSLPALRDDGLVNSANAPVIAVVGPTATGKSQLSIDLAQRLGAEVVNADSMQLYRGMDIGTAKLTETERQGVPHHQLDVLDVTQDANVAAYQERARADLAAIAARGSHRMLVGGSGLYVRAALDVIEFPGTDPQTRAELERRLEIEGPATLHEELRSRDPEAAAQVLPTNGRRIVRALEVITITGRPFIARMPPHIYAIEAIQIAIDVPRHVLADRVRHRVASMWRAGLVDEVSGLVQHGLRSGRTARFAVGYAEALSYLDGDIDEIEARERTVRATMRLVRRQEAWFRKDRRVTWLPYDSDTLPDLALKAIDKTV